MLPRCAHPPAHPPTHPPVLAHWLQILLLVVVNAPTMRVRQLFRWVGGRMAQAGGMGRHGMRAWRAGCSAGAPRLESGKPPASRDFASLNRGRGRGLLGLAVQLAVTSRCQPSHALCPHCHVVHPPALE